MGLAQDQRSGGRYRAPRQAGSSNRFGAIEHRLQSDPRIGEGCGEIIGVIGQPHSRGGTDEPVAVEGADENRIRRTAVAFEVSPLIGVIAVVEIGKGAKER